LWGFQVSFDSSAHRSLLVASTLVLTRCLWEIEGMTLSDRVFNAVAERCQIDRSLINNDTLIPELQIDSLAFMDLVMHFEEGEGVILTDVEVEEVLAAVKLGELVAILDAAKAHAPSKKEILS
jgi:acyl carrier protein